MPTVGLIGGLGPESTIDYYHRIIAQYRERRGDGSYPSIIINSIDVGRGIRLTTNHEHAELADWLVAEISRLAAAGCDFGAITANTPHVVFDEVRSRSSLPLLSIVECAREAARHAGFRTLALFGTRMTMQAPFYPDVFKEAGMRIATPTAADQDWLHDKYINELLVGTFLPQTRKDLRALVERMREEQGVDAVLLAGTELPLILREPAINGIALLDTTSIHVDAIVNRMLA